jgi:hypothetical protein
MTTALAASTRRRLGMAAKVMRIKPRRYSAVMNMVATTMSTISATVSPKGRLLEAVSAPRSPWTTAGAMSPEPLTTRELPARW